MILLKVSHYSLAFFFIKVQPEVYLRRGKMPLHNDKQQGAHALYTASRWVYLTVQSELKKIERRY